MGEVFITRKGGGGKAAAPTITITDVGGTWIELEITNNDAAPSGATIFVLANYDPTSETDFDLQASQNGFVFAVAQGATVTQLITGLDPDTSHTVSVSAAVIKKLPSSIITTDSTDLDGTGVTAPTVGPIVSDTFVGTNTTLTITVANSDTTIPLVIKANFTTSTTPPTTYPFETVSLAAGASTNLTLTGLTTATTFYIHARAFDEAVSSSNVVFGPYTTNSPLYDFTTWTFTNAGATGPTGPNISQVRSAYSSQSWAQNNAYLSMINTGIQDWTVPASGSYRIETWGAQGGTGNQTAGLGARMRGDFSLTQGEVVRILVAQQGMTASAGCNSGGGGGSFVWRNTGNSLLIVAGGGAGSGGGLGVPGQDGTTAQNGTGIFAGSNGNGGSPGGAGWNSNGGIGYNNSNTGNQRPLNGGNGGNRGTSSVGDGGFGGGAGAAGESCGNGGPGGGGGYSGGGGPSSTSSGSVGDFSGGGSFNSGTNQSNSAGVRSGNGQVSITKL